VTERPGQTLLDAVVARLKPGRSLLVLDNCEHLIDDTAEFLTTLLGETTDVHVLTTSRTRIGVAGERVVPAARALGRRRLDRGAVDSEAVALFFDRARTLDTQFDADPVVVGELCAELDGNAARDRIGPPPAARRSHRRTAGRSGRPAAGCSAAARAATPGTGRCARMLDWSHELLDDEERTALRRSPLRRRRDLAAAAAIIDLPPSTVADLVGRLADRSLLVHRHDRHRWRCSRPSAATRSDKLAGSR